MMDLPSAIKFVQINGDAIELARLDYLLNDRPVPPAILAEFQSSQRPDGSWNPFWAPDYSSLDATCFHLAQAYQLGISQDVPAILRAFSFLASRQRADGLWEEERCAVDQMPAWVKPGDLPAQLYLTANCGYWLASNPVYQEQARKAASFLVENLDGNGQIPSFLHTHWLSGGLWYAVGMLQPAGRVMEYLQTRLGDLTANNLTWMITSLRAVNVPTEHELIDIAVDLLMGLQDTYGFWNGDDGTEYDIHTTLEALFALKLCEKI